jgi:hypothetical protein
MILPDSPYTVLVEYLVVLWDGQSPHPATIASRGDDTGRRGSETQQSNDTYRIDIYLLNSELYSARA